MVGPALVRHNHDHFRIPTALIFEARVCGKDVEGDLRVAGKTQDQAEPNWSSTSKGCWSKFGTEDGKA